MSYDWYLFRPTPGKDPLAEIQERLAKEEETLAAGEAVDNSGPPREETERLKRRLVGALQARNPRLEPSEFERGIELTDETTGMQITLCDDRADITVPYWHDGDEAKRAMDEVRDFIEILFREAGYVAYDPQLGRIVNPERDLGEAIPGYERIVRDLPRLTEDATHGTRPLEARPWWRFW